MIDNAAFLVAAYVVTALALGAYVISIRVRSRS